MSKPRTEIPSEKLAFYIALVDGIPEIERKGKTTPYTSINGHMFSFLSKNGTMGLRLSESDRTEFMREFNSPLMEQHGRVMKEYVEVPETLLKKTIQASEYLRKSLTYVAALKPKPAKKKG